MSSVLDVAIKKVRGLEAERQAYAAQVLEYIAQSEGVFRVPQEHRKAVLCGLAQAKQKKFASAAAVKRVLNRSWA